MACKARTLASSNMPAAPITAAPIIALKNITFERDEVILKQLNFSIQQGEHWVIMGPNGCGKSTLVHLLTGYLQPSSGSLNVLDGLVNDDHGWADKRRHIGVVSPHISHLIDPDELAGDVVLSGRDGIVNIWEKAPPQTVQDTIKTLKHIHAWHLRDREWSDLSQGERQRILIGRAMMNHAKVLILDEPCAGLDPAAREHYLHFLKELLQNNTDLTLIMITHHVEEILPEFTHALLLKHGEIQNSGTIENTITSSQLSQLFESDIQLEQIETRYYSKITSHSHSTFSSTAQA